jgi:SAM-dependent methyltransferase
MPPKRSNKLHCSLCYSDKIDGYHRDQRRHYLQCGVCGLVFVPERYHLSAEAEKTVYDSHQNSPLDDSYRRFLTRLSVPLLERLTPQSKGLDFGSGPGPTLSVMLEDFGHRVALYDLYYAEDPAVLEDQYDFITCTEVIEHIARPRVVLEKLWALLKPGGYLALMTKQVTDEASFSRWHYKNDLTHISFFSRQTFAYLGSIWSVEPLFIGADVIIFRRPTAARE